MSAVSPTGEMSAKNLLKVASLFWQDGEWIKPTRFYYDSDNKRRFYQVDSYDERYRIFLEYEGPGHCNNIWKIKRNRKK